MHLKPEDQTENQNIRKVCSRCGGQMMAWETVCPVCGMGIGAADEETINTAIRDEFAAPDYRSEE